MKFTQLAAQLVQSKLQLDLHDWPDFIYFDSETQKRIKKIRSFSMKPRNFLFLSEGGSTAYEYAITIVYVIDTLYYSNPIKGNYRSVTPIPRIQIKPLQDDHHVSLELMIGEYITTSKKYSGDWLQNGFEWGTVMSIHTHPRVYLDKTRYYHSWFSMQDFSFLMQSPVPMVGLVTDNDVWIACQTNDATMPDSNQIQEMTKFDIEKRNDAMQSLAVQISMDTNILFYKGTISGKLEKI